MKGRWDDVASRRAGIESHTVLCAATRRSQRQVRTGGRLTMRGLRSAGMGGRPAARDVAKEPCRCATEKSEPVPAYLKTTRAKFAKPKLAALARVSLPRTYLFGRVRPDPVESEGEMWIKRCFGKAVVRGSMESEKTAARAGTSGS